jgi:hypothetical protein
MGGWVGKQTQYVMVPYADWNMLKFPDRDQAMEKILDLGAHTAAVVASNELTTVGVPGPRWEGAPPAPLERVLFHLLQEYARHLGHLDIVAELAGAQVGE